ncbi:GGDEF domain-containing protein [Iodidimonas nitroreducens]|uniref:diguanylate cyclase n=1 Tax=Iodidimonas nitroreducens TaxID=1236968 RepID=A0A5A7N9E1_9PROT|nr:GGDEF domain-containing protein [Iodidimonas nitroreducens]GAK33459.1 cellulose synthesis regulatory protein [alpha proteobacterium Q-1]GER04394.1 GGDEF domain-containing protein [Iodidimonas nitroreducens]
MRVDAMDASHSVSSDTQHAFSPRRRSAKDRQNRAYEEAAERVDQDADALYVFGIPEEDLTTEVRAAVSRILKDNEALRRQLLKAERVIADLHDLADHDSLTPTLNRRAFMRELNRLLALAKRHKTPLALAYFDIDDMKQINDRLSHAAGDAALLRIGEMLVEHCRSSDLVARLGGDEFAIVLPHSNAEQAAELAARLTAALAANPPMIQDDVVDLKLSYGVSMAQADDQAEQLLARADADMYAHKAKTKAEGAAAQS